MGFYRVAVTYTQTEIYDVEADDAAAAAVKATEGDGAYRKAEKSGPNITSCWSLEQCTQCGEFLLGWTARYVDGVMYCAECAEKICTS